MRKICKFFYNYYTANEKNLHISNDFIQLYTECSKPLFSRSENGVLRQYNHYFWYNRAAGELAEKAIKCEPYKHEIDTINSIIKNIDPIEYVSNLLDGVLFILGLLFLIPLVLLISQPIGIIVIILEFVVGILLFIKKILLTKTELLQKINDKFVFDSLKIDKNFRTKEKLFALNVWNNILSKKSTFSTLFIFLLCKLKFPRLYELIFFALMEVTPSLMLYAKMNGLEKRIRLLIRYREKKPIIDAKRKELFSKS
ncbi:MAG: hypothetical protein NTY71_08180 [Methanoregula sp.]|nr:hypothetical protein [Methanoregula sp.]